MKDIRKKLITLLKKNYCVPQIAKIARKIKEPSTTIHYNLRRLEKEGIVRVYKAVFDYKKIDMGYCCYVLINLSPTEYSEPERISKELSKYEQIESIDIVTGDYELILKVRTKDIDEYYEFVKKVLSRKGIAKIKTITSLKQIKTEFVEL